MAVVQIYTPAYRKGPEWTQERQELLRQLWTEGLSCSQIATQLGGITRNSVIGKANRLKLPPRGGAAFQGMRRKRDPHVKRYGGEAEKIRGRASQLDKAIFGQNFRPLKSGRKPNPPLPAEPLPPPEVTDIPRIHLYDLENHHCRFPCSEPADGMFCGEAKIPGLPYCAIHSARCFQPPEVRTRPFRMAGKGRTALGHQSEVSKMETA